MMVLHPPDEEAPLELDASIVLAPLGLYLLGALSGVVFPSLTRVPYGFALAGSLSAIAAGLWALANGPVRLDLPSVAPYAALNFRLDALSAYFLLIIGVLASAVSVYSFGYADARHYGGRAVGTAYCAFVGAMAGLVLADGVFSFLVFWELMSLASFVLVVHEHKEAEVRRAGFIYLAMTHAGAGFLVAGFMLLAGASGSLLFDGFRTAAGDLSPLLRDGAFLLFLVGFSAKAGVIPLHVWLPRAHPAAPSHVSALMSGVMIKTAIYGLIRVSTEFLAPMPAWWGWVILALGAVSAVLGVIYALMDHDLKRLLAYCSVENIGVILLGVGASMVLSANGARGAAVLALSAALFHTLNHALFKGLLFLGAGAVHRATGTRDMEKLGGLIHAMPWTAATFLVGSAAISAIPPFNGFASEWMTLQALLQVVAGGDGPPAIAAGAVATAALALTGGLAAFCFIKAFGVTFLGVARSAAAEHVREAPAAMTAAMAGLALACAVLGLFPTLAVQTTGAIAAAALAPTFLAATEVITAAPVSSYVPTGMLAAVAAFAVLALLVVRLIFGPVRERVSAPWVCGVLLEPRMQYSASALAKPVRIIFQGLLRPYRISERRHTHGAYFVTEVHYEGGLRPVYEAYLYRPVVSSLVRLASRVRRVQSGSLRLYLSYIFATLVVVLLLTR